VGDFTKTEEELHKEQDPNSYKAHVGIKPPKTKQLLPTQAQDYTIRQR
jgi:hypothetical protein